MANVPPPRSKVSRLPTPPVPAAAPQNMAEKPVGKLADMNFKVDQMLKDRVKLEAVARGMTMRDLCEAAFKHYFVSFPHEIRQNELL
jgi:hypothetical protein